MTTAEHTFTFEGATYRPGEAEYEEARHGWNRCMDQKPALIVEAQSVQDVQTAVRYANAHDLPIAVRNTGHGAPRNADGAVLIVVAALKTVEIDSANAIAHVGGGAIWSDVIGPAFEEGFGVPCGSSPAVGVVGYTLGGGYGLLLRKHGLAIDHLVAVKIVTPDGELVTASATEHPDLFWAIRGGGGSYGVVVEVTLSLVRESHVFGGTVMYPAEQSAEVLAAFQQWTHGVGESVTSSFYVISFPPLPFIPEPLQGRAFACVSACATGEDGESQLAPIRSLPGVFMDTFRTMPFTDVAEIFRDPVDPLPAQGNGVLVADLKESHIAPFIEAIGEPTRSPNLKIEIRHLGGAASRVAHDETAIGKARDAQYVVFALGVPFPGLPLEVIRAHSEGILAVFADVTICRGPLNWVGEGHVPVESLKSALGEGFDRHCAVKSVYDPGNRFRFAGSGVVLAE